MSGRGSFGTPTRGGRGGSQQAVPHVPNSAPSIYGSVAQGGNIPRGPRLVPPFVPSIIATQPLSPRIERETGPVTPKKICPLLKKLESSEDLYDSIIQVRAGSDGAVHHLHKGLLCRNAGYFAGALSGHFHMRQDQIVTLSDTSKEVLEAFKRWLYQGNVSNAEQHLSKDNDVRLSARTLLVDCWIFGDMRAAPAFKNAAVDELVQSVAITKVGLAKVAAKVWTETKDGSQLRLMMLEVMGSTMDSLAILAGWFRKKDTEIPCEFLLEIMQRRGKNEVYPVCEYQELLNNVDLCSFHDQHRSTRGHGAAQGSGEEGDRWQSAQLMSGLHPRIS